MQLDLVTFEQAKTLKELGFPQDIDTTKWYSGGRVLYSNKPLDYLPVSFIAPTLELVAKWLRDKKQIGLSPVYLCADRKWKCQIAVFSLTVSRKGYINSEKSQWFETFEEALSTGIDKAIEILKNINNVSEI